MPGIELDESLVADISAVENLTSLSDISRLLHDTLAKERGLEAELDQLLHRRGELEKGLLDLHAGSREVNLSLLTLTLTGGTWQGPSILLFADIGSGQSRGRESSK